MVPTSRSRRPALAQHVRDAERAADLDQLAPAHQDLAAFGQGVHEQEHRGRAVVHDHRGLGAQEIAQTRLGVRLAVAPLPGREVELEVRVRRGDLRDPGRGLAGQRGPAEVRVHDHAGGVDHGNEGRGEPTRRGASQSRRPGRAGARERPSTSPPAPRARASSSSFRSSSRTTARPWAWIRKRRSSSCRALSTDGMSRRSSLSAGSPIQSRGGSRVSRISPATATDFAVAARGERFHGREPILAPEVLAQLLLAHDPLHGQLESHDPAELGRHEGLGRHLRGRPGLGRVPFVARPRGASPGGAARPALRPGAAGRRRGRRRSSRWARPPAVT